MLRMHSILRAASILVLPAALGGCAGALVVGGLAAAGGAGYQAGQERGVDGGLADFNLKNNIETAWYHANPIYMSTFIATVYNGDVLLTGAAPDPEMKRQVVEIAGRVPGVRHIYDQIEVGHPDTWDVAKDSWITTQLRSKMVLEKGIRSGNYTIETADGSVYLMGSARSQIELDKTTYLARYIPGVKRVISYVQLRTGIPVAEENGPAPVSSGGPSGYGPPSYGSPSYGPPRYAPPSAAPESGAPIQVRPL
ncbi:MAG TPA: BON domain-containing protein [Stellaceae bacterium]|nr:BON domain-containing protein [Stellaceae bacterium]